MFEGSFSPKGFENSSCHTMCKKLESLLDLDKISTIRNGFSIKDGVEWVEEFHDGVTTFHLATIITKDTPVFLVDQVGDALEDTWAVYCEVKQTLSNKKWFMEVILSCNSKNLARVCTYPHDELPQESFKARCDKSKPHKHLLEHGIDSKEYNPIEFENFNRGVAELINLSFEEFNIIDYPEIPKLTNKIQGDLNGHF